MPADRQPLAPGLEVSGQNYRGSLAHDRDASIASVRPLPAGRLLLSRRFYRPKGAWKRWEPIIRTMAGLGRVNPSAPHRLLRQGLPVSAIVAVVGGGPAGLSAAPRRRGHGAEVLLIEDVPELGGVAALRPLRRRADARPAGAWPADRRDRGEPAHRASTTDAVCTGLFADNWPAGDPWPPAVQAARASRWCSLPARSSSRWCSATTTCPGSCSARRAQRLMRL